jgi:hypothetical protein
MLNTNDLPNEIQKMLGDNEFVYYKGQGDIVTTDYAPMSTG